MLENSDSIENQKSTTNIFRETEIRINLYSYRYRNPRAHRACLPKTGSHEPLAELAAFRRLGSSGPPRLQLKGQRRTGRCKTLHIEHLTLCHKTSMHKTCDNETCGTCGTLLAAIMPNDCYTYMIAPPPVSPHPLIM